MRLHQAVRTSHVAAPIGIATNLVIAAVATTLTVVIGMLVRTGNMPWILPGNQPLGTTFPAWGSAILTAWMFLAVCISLLAPCIVLGVWRKHADVRTILFPYIGMLLIQIPTEMIATQLFFPNITAIVGLLYTCYRLYQLWYCQQYVAVEQRPRQLHDRVIHRLLWIGLWFWTGNLMFLIFTLSSRVIKL